VRRSRKRAPLPPGFGTIWTSVAIDLVGFGIVFPILPLYARRFHVSSAAATGLVAAFSAASFVFSPIWGRVSDRIGRKPILILSLVGTAVGSLLTGLAGGIALLYVGRVVDGISGASISVAQASASDVASPEQRPRLFGLLGAAFGLGFVAGPAIGALAALGGPRLPFFVAAALAGVNAVVAIRRLPETHHPGQHAAPSGGNPGRALLGARGVGRLIAIAACALAAFSAFEATFALFGHRRLGLGIGSSAATFAVIGLVIVVVQGGLVYPVVSWLGEVTTLRAGLTMEAVALVLLAFARGWALAAPALLALTVGQGLLQTTMSSVLAGRADPRRRGEVLGAQQAAGGLARVIGPIAGGVLFERVGVGSPYVVGAGLMVVALLLLQTTSFEDPGVGAPEPFPSAGGVP
jgi:MFS transporter, DHA1 family, tetracycline resistance protein